LLEIAKNRGHFGQTDCLKSLSHRIAFTPGIHEGLAIRLQIPDGEVKAFLGFADWARVVFSDLTWASQGNRGLPRQCIRNAVCARRGIILAYCPWRG
jgi:hypothetical protein